MAKSKAFHWVLVDRDKTPGIPKRLNVRAYPSLLVLGHKQENIYRFQSFKLPAVFLPELEKGLARWQLYRADKPWELEPTRAPSLTQASVRTIPAPSIQVPAGLAYIDGDLFVAQGNEVNEIDPRTGAHKARLPLPPSTMDITTDGKLLYCVKSTWDAEHPIVVVHPTTGREVGKITPKTPFAGKRRMSSRGIAWANGHLYVLEIFGKLHEVDPKDGALLRSRDIGKRWVFGLAFDGKDLVAGSRTALLTIDPDTAKVTNEHKTNYSLRSVGLDRKGHILCMEQPVWGHDKKHENVQVWPRPGKTVIHFVKK